MKRYERIPGMNYGESMFEKYVLCKNSYTLLVVCPSLVLCPLIGFDVGKHQEKN